MVSPSPKDNVVHESPTEKFNLKREIGSESIKSSTAKVESETPMSLRVMDMDG